MEETNYSEKMNELETIWRKKMAETRVEYQKLREMLDKRQLIPEFKDSDLHIESS